MPRLHLTPQLRVALIAAFVAPASALHVPALHAQRVDDMSYSRAEQLLPWNTSRLVIGDAVQPQWMKDGNRFWYRSQTRSGADFVVVDAATNTRSLLFDNARLAAVMSAAADSAFDADRLPFRAFRFGSDGDDEKTIEFRTGKRQFVCDIVNYKCTAKDTSYTDAPYVRSPDKKWEAFISRNNVFVRPRGGGGDSVQLTTDGVDYWSYGLNIIRPQQAFRPQPRRPQIRWAPDSRHLLVSRADERRVGLMPYISYTSQRPRAFTQPYALPGDSIIPTPGFYIINRETKTSKPIVFPVKMSAINANGSARDSVWSEACDRLWLSGIARASKAAYLIEVDANTGQGKLIARDTGKTFVEVSSPQDPESWYVTKAGEAIWWSERDGWGHLYLMNGDGTVKRQLTSGPWQVGAVQYVDEATRNVYFTARGKESKELLYHSKLYRVSLDGGAPTLMTPEEGNHAISISPNGKWIVDAYSAIGVPAVSVLRDVATGRVVRLLEKADVSQLTAIGWKPAVPFSVKARDGVTDIHGVIYLPPRIDSTRKYPIISHIYPGPQVGSVGQWTFKSGGEPYALAELGFVVVQIDHLGTPGRSKAFHDNYYANFTDNGIPDHIAAIKQLGARYRWIDLNKVGIFGHSGGGFASTDAILRFPDFFKVAVSGAGNHDNRSYNIYWAEKYQGLLTKDTLRRGEDNFTASANKSYAANLRGHLLLMHGDMDDNVHPAMTIQLVDELIKANKTFDLIMAPNRPHSLNEPYFIRRRWDYFVQHLMGATPPVDYRITQPAGGAVGDIVAPYFDLDDLWNRQAWDELLPRLGVPL